MGQTTEIEWADATWPVVKGCDYVSPGCSNCYAATLIHRHSHNPNPKISLPLTGLTNDRGRWTGKIYLNEPHLNDPLKWKTPKRIFVPSHGDLFHEGIPFGFVMLCLWRMAQTPWHTYQILTKRPDRMADFFGRWADLNGEGFEFKNARGPEATRKAHPSGRGQLFADMLEAMGPIPPGAAYPMFDWMEGMINWPSLFGHIHLGFSAENQEWFDRRAVQAAPLMRAGWLVWVSAEPLLGPIIMQGRGEIVRNWLGDMGIRWVIVGGESGRGARPCRAEWIRDIVSQCKAANIACFVKQMGSNIVTRNDAIEDTFNNGDSGWPDPEVEHDIHGFREDYQGADCRVRLRDRKGATMEEWPADLRVREFPDTASD